jgi:hypothetical protein
VTICIAATSLRDRCIVAISDRMLSYSDIVPATEDATDKVLFVSADWRAMIAGEDINQAQPIIDRVRASLPKEIGEVSLDAMKRAFRDAYQAELQQQITDRFLGRYGLTLPSFLQNGFQSFGPQEFAKLHESIRCFDLGVQFIVFGLSQGLSHIFAIDGPGAARECSEEGFAIIGSGFNMALSVLSARSIKQLSLEQLVYRLCEAKFTSETAGGVGRKTMLLVLSANGFVSLLDPACIENLRIEWEQARNVEISPYTVQIIKDGLKSLA